MEQTAKYETVEQEDIVLQSKAHETSDDELDRRIILATQSGLPVVKQPYQHVAAELEISSELLMQRLECMKNDGRIRRIGIVPNHYRLGYTANGMSVWDVDSKDIDEIGQQLGELEMVTHCYQRPRFPPAWPYNLFAMVHGHDREEVLNKVRYIAELLGAKARQHDVLFSTRILKKTGLRLKNTTDK